MVTALGVVPLPNLQVPPVPTTFPPTSDPVQLAAQQQLLLAEQAAQAQMPAAIQSLASNPNVILQSGDLAKAKAVYDQYAAKSVQALSNIAQAAISGGPGSFTMMAPLIGAMLTAAAVAPVVGAAVAAGLAILDGIAEAVNSALNGQNSCNNPKTQWQLPGGACITEQAGRPTGPSDPAWRTWAQFEADYRNADGTWKVPPTNVGASIDAAFPLYQETIGCEIDKLAAMPAGGVRDFFLTYYRAWQHAAEQAINGFVMPSPWTIFVQTLTHWNATHPGPAVTLVGTPIPAQGGTCIVHGDPNDPNGVSYIGMLLNGDIPSSGTPAVPPAKQNLQLNTGGLAPWAQAIIKGLAVQPAKTSTPAKVAIASASVAGAGAVALAVTAWLTHQTFLAVTGKAWDWIKDTVTGKGGGYRARGIPGARENPLPQRCPTGSRVQTLLFSRHAFTPQAAAHWARAHGYRASKIDTTADYHRIRQRDPARFVRMRTVPFGRGVKAIVGWERC